MLTTDPHTIIRAMNDNRWKNWYQPEIGRRVHHSEAFYSYALELSGYKEFEREYIIIMQRTGYKCPPLDIAFPKQCLAIEIDTQSPSGKRSGKIRTANRKRKERLLVRNGWKLLRVRYRENNIEYMENDLSDLYRYLDKNGVYPAF